MAGRGRIRDRGTTAWACRASSTRRADEACIPRKTRRPPRRRRPGPPSMGSRTQIAHEDRSSQNGQDGCEDPRDRTLRCAEKLSRQVQTHACPGEGLPERIEYPLRLIRRRCGAVHDIIPRTTIIPVFHVSSSHVESRYENDCPPTAGNSFPSHESVTSHAMMHAERAPVSA